MVNLNKRKLLIFIVAYHAESTIESVVSRIPFDSLNKIYDIEILIVDDSSSDGTFETSRSLIEKFKEVVKITVLYNPINLGYGGNQKVGYHYAIKNKFDYVALVHGDGQYAPEELPFLLKPFDSGAADAVFGSRMIEKGGAIRGGMPLYKFVGNKILTKTQNLFLGSKLSEFHSGYRIYSVPTLQELPFELNTNDFHFDTEIIIQLITSKKKIVELPIPTYYGDEICRVNGIKYAIDVIISTIKSQIQKFGLLYDRKYDIKKPIKGNDAYRLKLGYQSTHSKTLDLIPPGSRVLDIGCAGGYIGDELKKRNCYVEGFDFYDLHESVSYDKFTRCDLNNYCFEPISNFDYVLILDVIEHLNDPEKFLGDLRQVCQNPNSVKFIISTGNIAYFPMRLMLLLGKFNYGTRGILDITHTRLFTFFTMKKLLLQNNFRILSSFGIAAPFPLVLGNNHLSFMLVKLNQILIKLRTGLFSYQMMFVVTPNTTLDSLLDAASRASYNKSCD